MVLMLIERGLPLDEVVFYDTGMEFQAIYDLRDDMLPIFQQHGIKYYRFAASKKASMTTRFCLLDSGKCGGIAPLLK